MIAARRRVVPRQRRGQRAATPGRSAGQGISPAPLHLVRVDLDDRARSTLTEICGLPNGIVANPPAVDETRRIAVGYDSGNGVLAAFDIAADGSARRRAGAASRTTRAIRSCSPTPASS